jgi:hypothetical protein
MAANRQEARPGRQDGGHERERKEVTHAIVRLSSPTG